MVKNLTFTAGDARDVGSIPGLRRCPGEGNGNPLQYSCLGNPKDRGACQSIVHGVAKNWTPLSVHAHARARTHTHTHTRVEWRWGGGRASNERKRVSERERERERGFRC